MKLKELTPGQLLRQIIKKNKMSQTQLAKLVSCSRAMICRIIKDERSPSYKLSCEIVKQFPLSTVQRELISWYLTKQHHKLEKLKHDYPNTFEDLRTSWLRKNSDSLEHGL